MAEVNEQDFYDKVFPVPERVREIFTEWASIDSFGTPYLRPLIPLRGREALREVVSRPRQQV